MGAKKRAYFLVHRDTGQRYPIRGPVVIGRKRGDIVFASDEKLSDKHCQVHPDAQGLVVQDLRSFNGTKVNGSTIIAEQPYILPANGVLSVGEQDFTLQAVTRSSRIRRRKKKSSSDGLDILFALVFIGIIFVGWRQYGLLFDGAAQAQQAQTQLAEIFENFQSLSTSFERQTLTAADVAERMQEQIIAPLGKLSPRLSTLRTNGSEQSHLLAAEMHFTSALSGHARAEAMYIRTGDAKYSDEADAWLAQLEQATTELRQLSNSQFPALVQSPLQMLEREMRQSLRDYHKLGEAAQNQKMSDKETNLIIRRDLMPKMNSTLARLGAVIPQNAFEGRKVLLEQKLMTATISQLKFMMLLNESGDQKYAHELEHWSAEIKKTYDELKQQIHPAVRIPATQLK